MIVFVAGDAYKLTPEAEAFLMAYATWPRWRRWLWRRGVLGR